MKRALGWVMGPLTALALEAPAMAQDYRSDRYDRYGYDRDRDGYVRNGTFRVGYDRGFEDGAREGDKDGRNRRRFELWNEGRYRDGDHGYRSSYGPKWEYRRGFQRGYEDGYRRAYASRRAAYRYDYRYYGDDRIIYESPRR